MTKSFKVVIVGAGLGGLSCAIACRLGGLEVELLEKTPKLEQVGAGIQVPPNAAKVLENYGLMSRMEEKGISMDAIELRRYKDGRLICSRPVAGEYSRKAGASWLVIHRADYHEILYEEAQRLGVVIKLGANVTDVNFEQSVVTIGENVQTKIKADVIVGADGLWSSTRNALLNPPSDPTPTGDLAYRGTFSRAQLLTLNDSRIEKLCNKKIMTIWMGPGKHSVFYPIKGGSEFNLVLLRPDNLPEGIRTVKGDINEMRASFEGWDDILNKIISCIPSVLKWKLYHHNELESWTKGSVVLLGDACHPTLPYQAQGAAMAVEDGAILGYLISATVGRLKGDGENATVELDRIRSVLKLYEGLRKARTTANVKGAIDNRLFFHLPDGPAQQERDSLLKDFDWDHGTMPWSWANTEYQQDLLGYNAVEDAQAVFLDRWKKLERN